MAFGDTDRPLAAEHDVALLDLDGVVYVGEHAVPRAAEALDAALARHGMRSGYVTNNASRPPAVVAEHLQRLGVHAAAEDVVTSAQAGARLLAERLTPGSRVLAVGGPGVAWALEERGLVAVHSADDHPVAVMQGYGPDVGWRELAEATLVIERGQPWVATNTDRTIPTPRGRVLGNGSLVAAVQHATGVVPLVAGKPEPPLMWESVERTAATQPLVVGDRLDTDIEGATRCGIPSLLVLTGVTEVSDLLTAPPALRPTYLGRDLTALLEPAPPVTVAVGEAQALAACGAVTVTVPLTRRGAPATPDPGWLTEALLTARRSGESGPGQSGSSRQPESGAGTPTEVTPLDLARALVAAAWGIADAGAAIGGPAVVQVR